ncbi:class I SAM-dependent methyltransferase [Nocardia sp. 2YAB30]|uniref:class I SAM-dependent methyltransferase n=1 Tax=Nocardia sp. 2YAB30 TaxID=3233022 RepID=UPI003F98A90D
MEKVTFTEEKATMLATLYSKVLDNRLVNPILGDQAAEDAIEHIDYDFERLGVTPASAAGIAARAKIIDDWAAEYLLGHPNAIVLHLGCGMDSRVFRLDPPSSVQWFDIDYPDVIDLRTRIYPRRAGYHLIGTPITDLAWLDRIPSGRPALIVAEGLLVYLEPAAGGELLRQLARKFPSGELIADMLSRLGVKLQKATPITRNTGSTLHWGIDDPTELEQLGYRTTACLAASDWFDPRTQAMQKSGLSRSVRLQLAMTRYIPGLRQLASIGRWSF